MPRKRPGWVTFCWLPPGEIILGVLEMPGTPQKPKWAANHQISPETGKNCQKNKWNSNISHSFPLWPTGAFWNEMNGIWKKWGGVRKVGKTSRREPGWVPFCGLSPGEKLFYWRCLAPLQSKSGQLLQPQNEPRNLQKNKPVTTKYFPFPTHSH